MTFLRNEDGQGMIEYALIIGLIAIVAIVALIVLGPKIRNMFNDTNKKLTTA